MLHPRKAKMACNFRRRLMPNLPPFVYLL